MTTNFFNDPSKYKLPDVSTERHSSNDIEIYGLYDKKRVIRYVPEDYPIPYGKENIKKWKVFGSYAYGRGTYGEKTPELIIGKPNQICTETFLSFGPFDTEFEAKAFKKYYNGKFFRALLGILKNTQHSTTSFHIVPLQNFTKKSDIDWSKSISQIDEQLYNKYNLNNEEREFIEKKVE